MTHHQGRAHLREIIGRLGGDGDRRTTTALLAAVLVCVTASMMLVLTPLLVDGLRHGSAVVSERSVALIGSADQTGMFIGAVLALLTLPRANRRRFAMSGLALLAIADCAALFMGRVSAALYLCRLLGGSGAGMSMAAAYAAFGDAARPERWFALFGLVQTAVGSALIMTLAPLAPRFGFTVWYAGSLLLVMFGLAVSPLLGARARRGSAVRATQARATAADWGRGLLVGATFFSLSSSASALWSNAESIGQSFGIGRQDAATALAWSLIASTAGSLVVCFSPRRWGRFLPTVCIAALYVGGIALLLVPQSAFGFLCAATAFQFGTNLGFYAVGAVAESDAGGRLAVVYLLAMKAGFAAGPVCAAPFVKGADFHLVVVGVLACASLLCALLAATFVAFSRRPAPGAA